MNDSRELASQRWVTYGLLVACLSLVSDGWSGKPSPILHQVLLLPFCVAYGALLFRLLVPKDGDEHEKPFTVALPDGWPFLLVLFQLSSMLMIVAQAHHFRAFGYRLTAGPALIALCTICLAGLAFRITRSSGSLFWAVVITYTADLFVAIRCFPLNYLRSDMLPVIGWADERLLQHLDPYGTMHVGSRLYDFPYLPGMLLAFFPAQMFHVDLRFATMFYLVAAALLIFFSTQEDRRFEAAALLGTFLLCPFLQYRHDLYLEPHWFTLVLAVVLLQRRHFALSALSWGVSCGIYQLSWIVVPFFFLHGYRRGGVREACRLIVMSLFGFLLMTGPFLRSGTHRITENTVGQWSQLQHALADPINVSYWLTYLIRPDRLQWVQAVVLTALFLYCWLTRRCTTLVDTLRWMACAMAVFIPLNVLVDGYFYLTLLVLLLLYVCVANGWWGEPGVATPQKDGESSSDQHGRLRGRVAPTRLHRSAPDRALQAPR